MPEFKKGDVVQLKSGGPRMTVEAVEGSGVLFCVWFDEKKTQQQRNFDEATLEPAISPGGAQLYLET